LQRDSDGHTATGGVAQQCGVFSADLTDDFDGEIGCRGHDVLGDAERCQRVDRDCKAG
jgi:hypothetical protein